MVLLLRCGFQVVVDSCCGAGELFAVLCGDEGESGLSGARSLSCPWTLAEWMASWYPADGYRHTEMTGDIVISYTGSCPH